MSKSNEIDASTSRFLARQPKETSDVLLSNFLCSGEIVVGSPDKAPQQKLKDIMSDTRWTRRMLEEWHKKGPQSKHFSVTPNPEFRAIYLVLLSLLEDQGKQANEMTENGLESSATTRDTIAEEQSKLNERISEHFEAGSTWEKVDMN